MHAFGPFRYDAEQRLLYRNGEVVSLAPKALDTLHVLLEHRGRVVSKEELMRLVWPDATVEEVGLARNISLLRKAIGDEAGALIETFPKRGYRFAAADAAAAVPGRRRWLPMAGMAAVIALAGFVYWQFYMPSHHLPRGDGSVTLAVIPFEQPPGAPGSGFHDALVAELTTLDRVHVISQSTVRRYRQFHISPAVMARVLGLEVILEGSVQAAGSRIQVTPRLVDVHSGKLIWSHSYIQPVSDSGFPPDLPRTMAADVGRHLR